MNSFLKHIYFNFNKKIKKGKRVKIGRGTRFLSANIFLDDGVLIKSNCTLRGNICIGKESVLHEWCEVVGKVSIGKYCAIARNTVLQSPNHPTFKAGLQGRLYEQKVGKKLGIFYEPIEIGNDVWLGTRCIVLGGVNIGDGAIIGAGSIVTKDVEPYSIAVGNPAVHKKYRFPKNIREQLLEIKWWNWSDEKIARNRKFFDTDLTKVEDINELIK